MELDPFPIIHVLDIVRTPGYPALSWLGPGQCRELDATWWRRLAQAGKTRNGVGADCSGGALWHEQLELGAADSVRARAIFRRCRQLCLPLLVLVGPLFPRP